MKVAFLGTGLMGLPMAQRLLEANIELIAYNRTREKLAPLKGKAQELPLIAVGAMLATIIVKGIIWFGCIPIKTTQVQALAQDCKTDVIFNTISLLFPFVGAKADIWWLDPAGAGLLSLFIIWDWAGTCFEGGRQWSYSVVEDTETLLSGRLSQGGRLIRLPSYDSEHVWSRSSGPAHEAVDLLMRYEV